MVNIEPRSFLDDVRRARLIAIIRGDAGQAAVATASALFESGVRLVEVALTTPDALAAIRSIARKAPPGCRVGAGTVLSEGDVAAAIKAGATFAVTPGMAPSVPACVAAGLPVLVGALTPTEALAARDAGATAVKLFPASLGGPGYLKALRDPLPDLPFIPVGGVGVLEAEEYLRMGAVAVGVGGPLVGDAASGGDLAALRMRARTFVDALAERDR